MNFLVEISRYFKSHDFKKAILGTGLMVVLGVGLYYMGWTHAIVGVCVGILLTSFVDIQGDSRLRIISMLVVAGIMTANFLIINLLYEVIPLRLLYIAIAGFLIAFLSIYGNRATLVSFSGLMSIVLSLIRNYSGEVLLLQTMFLLGGSIAYIMISALYHWLTRRTQIVEQLGRLAALTADFIQLRLQSYNAPDAEAYEPKLVSLQIEIIEKQDALRSLIFSRRKESGFSHSRSELFMILVALIDIMELAIANPSLVKKFKADVLRSEYYLSPFIANLAYMAKAVRAISRTLLDDRYLFDQERQSEFLKEQDKYIKEYVAEMGLPAARSGALAMHQLRDYISHQGKKIDYIFKIIHNEKPHNTYDINKGRKFLVSEYYNLEPWKQNFHSRSPIFRHATRLTLAMIVGYSFGLWIGVDNAYWILLTIVVIMRPSYGLTKTRSINRVLGTVVGVLVAIGIVLITKNVYIFITLAAVANIFAFSMLTRNYFLSSVAVTLSVIFVFSVLQSDQWDVIQYRLIDTVIGGVFSLAFSYLIFPHWEYAFIDNALSAMADAIADYQESIHKLIKDPAAETQYRLNRKMAFTQMSELQASLQRLLQDPQSKQYAVNDYIAIVTWFQELLSAQAKLGTYISDNTSLFGDQEEVLEAMLPLVANMRAFAKGTYRDSELLTSDSAPFQGLQDLWESIQQSRNEDIAAGKIKISEKEIKLLQEINLIKGELEWMQELSGKIHSTKKKIGQSQLAATLTV